MSNIDRHCGSNVLTRRFATCYIVDLPAFEASVFYHRNSVAGAHRCMTMMRNQMVFSMFLSPASSATPVIQLTQH
jgi:hypothetical protein